MIYPKNEKDVSAAILYWESMVYNFQLELEDLAETADYEDIQASQTDMERVCNKMMIAEQIIKRLKKEKNE